MSVDKKDFDKIAKDHLRMQLEEYGWTDKLTQMVKSSVVERIKNGQMTKNIKFEQLYKDVREKARDLISTEIEVEFHQKYNEYMSSNLDETKISSSSSVQTPMGRNIQYVPSDIPSDVISTDSDDE